MHNIWLCRHLRFFFRSEVSYFICKNLISLILKVFFLFTSFFLLKKYTSSELDFQIKINLSSKSTSLIIFLYNYVERSLKSFRSLIMSWRFKMPINVVGKKDQNIQQKRGNFRIIRRFHSMFKFYSKLHFSFYFKKCMFSLSLDFLLFWVIKEVFPFNFIEVIFR